MPLLSPSGTNRNRFADCEGASEFRQALRSIRAAGGSPIEAGELQPVREFLRRRRLPINGRAFHERKITEPFNRELSLLLDAFLEWDDWAPITGALQSNRTDN